MGWTNQLKGDSLSWLLETDSPGVRYLALRHLTAGAKSTDLRQARKAAHQSGPIAKILRNMHSSGFWARPGTGYNPKYSTSWTVRVGAAATPGGPRAAAQGPSPERPSA